MTKNNEKFWRWARLVLAILVPLLVAVYAYGRLNGRVETIESDIVKVSENEKAIVGLKKDVEYIRQAVDRIEGKIDK